MRNPLKNAVDIIIKVVKPDKIILFGSRATGENKQESDYDLLVLKKGAKKQRKLTQEIYLNFKNIGAPIDVIVVDLQKFEELKTDPYLIYSEADSKGKVIYEKS